MEYNLLTTIIDVTIYENLFFNFVTEKVKDLLDFIFYTFVLYFFIKFIHLFFFKVISFSILIYFL